EPAAQQPARGGGASRVLAVALQAGDGVPARAQQRLQLVHHAFLPAGRAVAVVEQQDAREGSHQPAILARCQAVAIALVTNVLTPYRVPLYALLAERYGVEVLCFGAGAD